MEKEQIEGLPPIRHVHHMHDALPGEVVMTFRHGDEKAWGLEWTVRKLTAGKHFPEDNVGRERQREVVYEAATPYRMCVYQGDSAEAAIGSLLLGVGLLSRDGAFNPNEPEQQGDPPIQHVMTVLSERQAWYIERRAEKLRNLNTQPGPHLPQDETAEHELVGIARLNDIIAALATTIAAMARVKDL